MQLIIAIVTILLAWRWADWRNWQQYHSTLLYVALCNLLYDFFYEDRLLWMLVPDLPISPKFAEMFFTFLTLPGTTLLFLTNYPIQLKQQIVRNIVFIVIYIFLEWLGLVFNKIEHQYGWNMWYSLVWDCLMFPLIALHYKKPLLAYVFTIIFAFIVLMIFPAQL